MSDQVKLVGPDGAEYSTSSDASFAKETIFCKDINPGISMKGSAYFNIPVNVNPEIARVDAGILDKAVDISLT